MKPAGRAQVCSHVLMFGPHGAVTSAEA
jgi:hypothetical protein